MKIRINFVDSFDSDLASNIFTLLNDPSDLIRASAVSHSWRNFVIANGLCKKLLMRKVPQVNHITYAVREAKGITKLSKIASRSAFDWGTLVREHKIFSLVLEPLSKPKIYSLDWLVTTIGASSTDQFPSENITNTLNPIDKDLWGAYYWCSEGQKDPNAPENLLYRLNIGACILSEVHIRPFEAFWEPGNPVYSAKWVRFRVGHSKSLANEDRGVDPADGSNINEYVWTYTSPRFAMTQESRLQEFKLPEPVFFVGGVVMIELFGRAQKEEKDGLFYICVGSVRFLGCDLDSLFECQMKPSGGLQVMYIARDFRDKMRKLIINLMVERCYQVLNT